MTDKLDKLMRKRLNAPDFAQPQKRNPMADLAAGFGTLALVVFCVVIALAYLPIKAI